VKVIRPIVGHKDNLPENYYERFEQFWGHFKRKSGIIGLNSPLMLFPVRDLDQLVRDTFVKKNPILSEITDSLFVCVDHFKNVNPLEKVVDKRVLSSYSIENLNLQLKAGKIKFQISSLVSSRKAYVEKLTDGYMLDLPMRTDIIGTVLGFTGVCEKVEQVLIQMDSNNTSDMSQRYNDDSYQANVFDPNQYQQRGQQADQNQSGYQQHPE
jgi:hypothetical protein